MTSAEWVFKYIFRSKILNIAIIRHEVWARKQRVDCKLPFIIFEYKHNGCWHQKGFIK